MSQVTRDQLMEMTGAEIVDARDAGRLDHLLGEPDTTETPRMALPRRDHPVTEALNDAAHGSEPSTETLDAIAALIDGAAGRSLRTEVERAASDLLARYEAGARPGGLWPEARETAIDLIAEHGVADWRPEPDESGDNDPRKLAARVAGDPLPVEDLPEDHPRRLADEVERRTGGMR